MISQDLIDLGVRYFPKPRLPKLDIDAICQEYNIVPYRAGASKSTSNYLIYPHMNIEVGAKFIVEDTFICLNPNVGVSHIKEDGTLTSVFAKMQKLMGKEDLIFMINLYQGPKQFMYWHYDHAQFIIASFGSPGTFAFKHNSKIFGRFDQDNHEGPDHELTVTDRSILKVSKECDRTYMHSVRHPDNNKTKRLSIVGFAPYEQARY